MSGIAKVRVADDPDYAHVLAEPLAQFIVALAPDYDGIVAPSTASAKNVAPRAAALLDVMQVSDVTKVLGPKTFERPIYAGNAIQTVESTDPKIVVTVRTASFGATGQGGQATIEPVAATADSGLSSFVGEALAKSDRPELTSARIIISGGRAMQKAENFKTYIEPVADKLGAAMGASRAAVDAGYAPNDWQAKPARSWRRSSISRSASRARSSIFQRRQGGRRQNPRRCSIAGPAVAQRLGPPSL